MQRVKLRLKFRGSIGVPCRVVKTRPVFDPSLADAGAVGVLLLPAQLESRDAKGSSEAPINPTTEERGYVIHDLYRDRYSDSQGRGNLGPGTMGLRQAEQAAVCCETRGRRHFRVETAPLSG